MSKRSVSLPAWRNESRSGSTSKSPPAECTRVTPSVAASCMPATSACTCSARDGAGTSFDTSPLAFSLSAPVASPFASRTIAPLAGSGVARVMPASASAFEFTQLVCPSYPLRKTGRSGKRSSRYFLLGSASAPNMA